MIRLQTVVGTNNYGQTTDCSRNQRSGSDHIQTKMPGNQVEGEGRENVSHLVQNAPRQKAVVVHSKWDTSLLSENTNHSVEYNINDCNSNIAPKQKEADFSVRRAQW